MTGRTADGRIETVRVVPEGSPIANYGFDVTPARLVAANADASVPSAFAAGAPANQ